MPEKQRRTCPNQQARPQAPPRSKTDESPTYSRGITDFFIELRFFIGYSEVIVQSAAEGGLINSHVLEFPGEACSGYLHSLQLS